LTLIEICTPFSSPFGATCCGPSDTRQPSGSVESQSPRPPAKCHVLSNWTPEPYMREAASRAPVEFRSSAGKRLCGASIAGRRPAGSAAPAP
jgi:hypothetical protein